LSDADHAIAKAYGVPITPGGFHERVTFVIDEEGVVAKVFPAVKVSGHADEVLAACSVDDGK
jgi:peroxiredoxin Q/BCP